MQVLKAVRVIAIGIALLSFSNCNKDNISPQEAQLKKLMAKEWSIVSVFIDEVDHTALFADMQLTFGDKTYETTNGTTVWPSSGTWMFENENGTVMTRDDGTSIAILEVTETTLRLSLTWNETTFSEGRRRSVAGEHIFQFE